MRRNLPLGPNRFLILVEEGREWLRPWGHRSPRRNTKEALTSESMSFVQLL